jgi:hypothetical protein
MRLLTSLLIASVIVPATAAAQDFVPAPRSPETAAFQTPSSLLSADFNTDGKADLAFLEGASGMAAKNEVQVMLASGGGELESGPSSPSALPAPFANTVPVEMVSADFNADTKPDLAVSQRDGDGASSTVRVSVVLGDGAGGFAPAPGTPIKTLQFGPGSSTATHTRTS